MTASAHRTAGSRGWLAPSRALLVLGLLLVAAIAGFVAWSGWVLRSQALTGAERQLSNLSLVLEEQTSRSLHSVDMVLGDAVERMQRIGDLQFARGSSLLQSTLRERAGMLTMIDSLQVLDQRGVLMVDTRRFPSPLESQAGSELFRAHARESAMEHLGEAVCPRMRPCLFTVSRRVNGPRGEFLGVVVAQVRTDFFRDLYRTIDLGPEGRVELARLIGGDVAGYRADPPPAADDADRSGLLGDAAALADRVWEVWAHLPGRADWLQTSRELGVVPLSITVSMSRRTVFAEWHEQMRMLTAGAVTMTALMLVLMAVLSRQFAGSERAARVMRRMVEVDTLTGVASRSRFDQQLAQALQRARASGERTALLLIDLDRFQTINDSLGHRTGDELLKQVARRLTESMTQHFATALVARLGGDEFAVLIERSAGAEQANAAARQVLDALSRPFRLDGDDYHVTASVGIAGCPDDCESADDLLAHADVAMYRAKELGKNTYQSFRAQMSAHMGERLALESALRQALARDEFVLHYQPKLDLASGRITGMEALVRWQHPERGLVSPATFIPLAEEIGVIVPLGRWVLETACRQLRDWQDAGMAPLQVAVNLSARQFVQASLTTQVREVLQDTGLDASALELEITESMVMRDPEKAIGVLRQLKAMGITLSIDDFGTGYSSLAYLKRFPIDGLKIDRSFIKDIPGDADDVAITHTIIAMAHALNLKVIAEGVETEDQKRFLQNSRCDVMQGYLLAKPMPAALFEAFMAEHEQVRASQPLDLAQAP